MKKLFYILFAVATISLTVTSCTEEEVKPKTELDNGGGGANDPINKGN
jgi:hypothetical protein